MDAPMAEIKGTRRGAPAKAVGDFFEKIAAQRGYGCTYNKCGNNRKNWMRI